MPKKGPQVTLTTEMEPKHTWVKDLLALDGLEVEGIYLVRERFNGITKNGDPYVGLTLGDKTGEVEARLWGCPHDRLPFASKDKVIWVRAEVSKYKERPQLKVVEVAPREQPDISIFLDRSSLDPDKMLSELRGSLSSMQSEPLTQLAKAFFEDTELVAQFKEAPGAKAFHHSYLGGLLEHTLSVVQLADLITKAYPFLDRDLLLISALLHDVGKVRELKWWPYSIEYTDEGRLLGHILLGVDILNQLLAKIPEFPPTLKLTISHIILSHHGELEFGSPKRPKTLEAIALNLIDDLDAKLSGVKRFMEQDNKEGNWTEYNRMLSRFFLKNPFILETGITPSEMLEEERR